MKAGIIDAKTKPSKPIVGGLSAVNTSIDMDIDTDMYVNMDAGTGMDTVVNTGIFLYGGV
jgi:hypothetical protein